ncbi:MAG: TonB-dependent receptor [Vicinamibacterales bacterium]
MRTLIALVTALILTSGRLLAQDSAELSGFVSDPQRAMVPGAAVTLTMTSTSAEHATVTDGTGHYVFAALQPGTYNVLVTLDGFQTTEVKDVVLHAADRIALNLDLQLGAVSQRVDIMADAAQLVTRSGAVSTVVDREFVENLPMNGRSFQSLIALTPGVAITRTFTGNAGQFVVNGMRSDDNYFTVDGVSANLGLNNANSTLYQGAGGQLPAMSALGGTNSLVSMDAMQEFRIQTSTFAPEFGRFPGGQVGIVTRSGSNEFRGSAFDYFRHDSLNANEWFANRAGLPKAKERSNDFGGVLGGPIVKGQTFFFASYEGQRVRQPITINSFVPSEAVRTAATAIAWQKPFIDSFPRPTGAALADGTAPFITTTTNPASLDATSLRIDQRSGSVGLFGRYNYSPSSATKRSVGYDTVSNTKLTTATAGLTHSVSSRMVNEFRLNYSKNIVNGVSEGSSLGGATPLTDSSLPTGTTFATGLVGYQIISLTGAAAIGPTYGTTGENTSTQYNLTDTLSMSLGTHQFKAGFDYRRLTPTMQSPNVWLTAAFVGMTGVGGVASGVPGAAAAVLGPGYPLGLLTRNYSTFAQDTWSVSRRLTLTYGLRWDVNPALEGADERSALYPLQAVRSRTTVALGTRGAPLYDTSWKNVAPRLGLSYVVGQAGGRELVLSGGAGIFYSASLGTLGNATGGFPFGSQGNLPAGSTLPATAAQMATVPAQGQLPARLIYGADPDLVTPKVRQWNVSAQQALGRAQNLSVTYVGSSGRDLYRKFRYSAPNPTFASSVYVTDNTGRSDYKSLQFQFTRRLNRGLQATANYTWSHSRDNASDDQSFLSPDALYGQVGDLGDSGNDIRHAVRAAVTYQIPSPSESGAAHALLSGWAVDGLFNAQSAPPVDLVDTSGATISIEGFSFAPRPNVVPGQPWYLYGSQYPGGMAFNPAAFVSSGTQQGNLSRNALRGFGAWQADVALHRRFQLGPAALQFRAEVFNVFNHANFGPPNTAVGRAAFGLATQTLANSLGGLNSIFQFGGPRSGQLAIRLQF